MLRTRQGIITLWVTLLVMLAGAVLPSAHQVFTPSSSTIITLEVCEPSGASSSYTIVVSNSDESGGQHDAAHCLFCLLPSALDVLADTPAFLSVRVDYSSTGFIVFPPEIDVPSSHGRWQPHRPQAPPLSI